MSDLFKRLWEAADEAAPDHPYLRARKLQPNGARQDKDELMIPMTSGGEFKGLQFLGEDGALRYVKGSKIKGSCCKIGEIKKQLVICKDFVTGAAIHQETTLPVLVAFEENNIKTILEMARERLPEVRIIIASDRSFFKKAWKLDANAVSYPKDGETFGDMYLKGELFAMDLILGAQDGDEPRPPEEEPPPADGDYCPYPPDQTTEPDAAPFQILGYDRAEYFYLSNGSGQIRQLTPGEHTKANLMTLAPLNYWEQFYKKGKESGFSEDMAKNALIQTAHQRGIYDPDKIRGLGAWDDAGRSVLHLGNIISVDGRRVGLAEFKQQTQYIYERALTISDEDVPALSVADANKLVTLCELLTWERPINGKLLAGWCIAAVICGALSWRPHLFLTGESGTGKSWVINNIIKFICGQFLMSMLSSTTEPGMRRAVGNHSKSVFIDEFESENPESVKRIETILEFIRPCSCNNDSKIYKAKQGSSGVDTFTPRACVGMAAVAVNLKQRADISRISVLSMVKGKPGYFEEVIEPYWAEHFTPEFAAGIRARAIIQIPTINRNAKIFQRAATKQFGDRRYGDQYGSLLSCCYSLFSGKAVTPEEAVNFVERQNWDAHVAAPGQTDQHKCLATILEHVVRLEGGSEYNIAEMIIKALPSSYDKYADLWQATLARHGIKVIPDGFQISNSHTGIAKMLEKTPWSSGWGRVLIRLEGAARVGGEYIGGSTSRSVSLPMSYVREESK